jgi:hypothetical protein
VSLQNSPGPELASTPVEQKPRANIYTMMLVLSLCAIIVACIVLWLELKSYGDFPWWETKGVAPATSWLSPSDSGGDAIVATSGARPA